MHTEKLSLSSLDLLKGIKASNFVKEIRYDVSVTKQCIRYVVAIILLEIS